MKIYEIYDRENEISIGTLLYYEKSRTFIIELQDYLDEWTAPLLDEWTAPLLLTSFVKKGIFTIPRDISLLWVQERIIPSGRQNIGMILSNHKLKEYDEMTFLEKSGGRCSQDSLYIRKLTQMPDYAAIRRRKNLKDCVLCADYTLLCFFLDGSVKKVDLSTFANDDQPNIEKILRNDRLYNSGRITAGGYAVTFNDSMDLSASSLYKNGTDIPLTLEDFYSFVKKNVLDTTETCDALQCSRQNLAYMVKKGHLAPIKEDVQGNLYLKGDVLATAF